MFVEVKPAKSLNDYPVSFTQPYIYLVTSLGTEFQVVPYSQLFYIYLDIMSDSLKKQVFSLVASQIADREAYMSRIAS